MSDWCVIRGDSLDVLREVPDASIDSVVTDPPAGISFMGKSWDNPGTYGYTDGAERLSPPTVNLGRNPTCQACGGRKRAGAKTKACTCDTPQWNDPVAKDREAFIGFLTAVMRECLRVLKPGGHALVWAIPRTSHWTGMACELAGFEVRDVVTHLFGSGFPKSLNISKAIDASDGLKGAREVVRTYTAGGNAGVSTADKGGTYGVGVGTAPAVELAVTRGASERSRQWDGWGTALKPAAEFWILARKPLESTVARNVIEHGTGGINVDGCRIATDWSERPESWKRSGHSAKPDAEKIAAPPGQGIRCHDAGRWPANVVLMHDEHCVTLFHDNGASYLRCTPDCPVAMLDAQSGTTKSTQGAKRGGARGLDYGMREQERDRGRGDSGGASRFFYTAKTSTKEREAGCESLPKRLGHELVDREEGSAGVQNPRAGAGRTSSGRANHHPTVKPLSLMRWLVKLVTPPGGIVLDPFCGSGSTGCAAVLEGMDFLGIDQDADYVAIAEARITHWEKAT